MFSALSGATMPGPNSFWVRTCLRYAEYSADLPWLRRYIPTMRRGLNYLRGSAFAFHFSTLRASLLRAPRPAPVQPRAPLFLTQVPSLVCSGE